VRILYQLSSYNTLTPILWPQVFYKKKIISLMSRTFPRTRNVENRKHETRNSSRKQLYDVDTEIQVFER